jgi:metacaspase-1
MKKIKITLLFIILYSICINFSFSQPVKRALIIAIGNYPSKSLFPPISSLNDIPLIKTSLLNQEFKENNIKLLLDSQATRQGIISAFNNLINESNPGDIVVIHYSGHGQQMQDSTCDKPGCIDQALVAYDAIGLPTPEYYGQNHIRDHLIGEYIKKFRLKLGNGGMLNLFIDACYSGTMTKGLKVFRSVDEIFCTNEFREKYKTGKTSNINSTGIYDCIKDLSDIADKDKLSAFVFFAPCMYNQECIEITNGEKDVGPLSFGISKAFASIKPNETYRRLFEKICSAIISNSGDRQDPQAEGNLDNIVFSGLINYAKPYYLVRERTLDDDIIINGGEFSGIYKNTVVGFYPGETNDPKEVKPLYQTNITSVDNFTSKCKINDNSSSTEELMKMRVFVIKQGLPEKELKIKFMDLDENAVSKLSGEIKKVEYITITDSFADFILTGLNPDTKTNDGKLFILSGTDGSNSSETFDFKEEYFLQKVIEKLKDLFVYNLLRTIELNDDINYGVEMDVRLVNWTNIERKEYNLSPVNEISGTKNIRCGETVKITIKNSGNSNAYITLLNFAPDGSMKQVVPYEDKNKSNLIPPGDVIEVGFKSNDPGLEIYKVFATKEFINFNPIIRSRGLEKSTKGIKNPLEELLFNCYTGSKGNSGSFSGGMTKTLYIKVRK